MREAQFYSHVFCVKADQKGPLLVMCFGPVALFFVRFPFGPPHAPQAGPQKRSQISELLLQVASLGDFSDAVSYTHLRPTRPY